MLVGWKWIWLPIEIKHSISVARSEVCSITPILADLVVCCGVLRTRDVFDEEKKILKAVKFLVVLIN